MAEKIYRCICGGEAAVVVVEPGQYQVVCETGGERGPMHWYVPACILLWNQEARHAG